MTDRFFVALTILSATPSAEPRKGGADEELTPTGWMSHGIPKQGGVHGE
jgi:hypothetical protein